MNPFRHFALRNASSPFCRLAATSSPGRGKSFHSGGGLGKEGKFRPHSLTAGRNQPITGKLSALAKGSPFGRAGERSEPERVRADSDPLRHRLTALPPLPKSEALARRKVSPSPAARYKAETSRPCQRLSPRESWREATERVRPQYERKVSSYEIGYCSQKALHAASCTGAAA